MKRMLIHYRKNLLPMHKGSITCQDGQWILACPFCGFTMHINDRCIVQQPSGFNIPIMKLDIFPAIKCKNVNCKQEYQIHHNEVVSPDFDINRWVQEGPTSA